MLVGSLLLDTSLQQFLGHFVRGLVILPWDEDKPPSGGAADYCNSSGLAQQLGCLF